MKKALSIIVCLCMVATLLPITVLGAENDVWDGAIDINWYTQSPYGSTYYISEASQLAGISWLVNNGNPFEYTTVYLLNDIDLSDHPWTPIGTEDTPFKGTLNGRLHTISGLKTSATAGVTYYGLFGSISYHAASGNVGKVIDLNVIGDVSGKISGGIAGVTNNASIINCTFTGTVYGERFAGGIVGNANMGSNFEYCASYATVSTSTDGIAGKFSGEFNGSNMYACYNWVWGRNFQSSWDCLATSLIENNEAAFIMNGAKDAHYYNDYVWIAENSGVRTTQNAANGTTHKFILNPGYDGGVTETLYGNRNLQLPTPSPRTGYNFYMWLSDDGVYYNANDKITERGLHTLTALWYSNETCTVTVGTPENGSIMVHFPDAPDLKYTEGDIISDVNLGKQLIMEYTAAASYELRSMTLSGADAQGLTMTVSGDILISANFIPSVFSEETTVASVTVENTGAVTYYNTMTEAADFIDAADGSPMLITLFRDATIKDLDVPTKQFTLDGENGDTDFRLTITSDGDDVFMYTPHGSVLRNVTISAHSVRNQSNGGEPYFSTVENVSLTYNGYGASIYAENLTVRGYLNCSIIQVADELTFNNASVSCETGIRFSKLDLFGENLITLTEDRGRIGALAMVLITDEQSSSTGGTLRVTNASNWTPASGDIFVRYLDSNNTNRQHYTHERIIPDFIGYTGKRYKIQKAFVNSSYYTDYMLYNPSITLTPKSASTNTGVSKTLTAAPSIHADYISPMNYRWYCATREDGMDAVLIDGANEGTYYANQELGGTYYYYCVLSDSNGDDVQSNIVKITVYAPSLASPKDLAWGEGENAGVASWSSVENAEGYSVQLYKGGILESSKLGKPILTQETYCDFEALITNEGAGIYYFKVTALGNITTTSNSSKMVTDGYNAPAVTYDVTYAPGALADSEQVEIIDAKYHTDALTLRSRGFTRVHYTQVGWTLTEGGEKTHDLGATYTVNAPATFYPVWEITPATFCLSSTENKSFPAEFYGYTADALTAHMVTVSNVGGVTASGITLSLSGENADSFALTKTSLSDIAPDGSEEFGVSPNVGLAAGVYSAIVTVSDTNGNSEEFTVSFEVYSGLSIAEAPFYLQEDGGVLQYSRDDSIWTTYTGILPIDGGGESTQNSIIVKSGKHNIAINNVVVMNTSNSTYAPFNINSGAKVNLTISGTNSFQTGTYVRQPGILAYNNAILTINGGPDDILIAQGGDDCAGIGGASFYFDYLNKCGTVIINGGNITAIGGGDGAGIGGGKEGSGGTVTITGGSVIAQGTYGAGIGGGYSGDGGSVTVTGGILNATGGASCAGIGSGACEISGTTLTGGTVNISGGRVFAKGGDNAAGIGGGRSGRGDSDGAVVTITGGVVIAGSGEVVGDKPFGCRDIGRGSNGVLSFAQALTGGSLTISGGSVFTEHGTVDSLAGMKTPAGIETPITAYELTLTGASTSYAINNLEIKDADGSVTEYAYGINDVYPDENGKLSLWLPVGYTARVYEPVTFKHGVYGSGNETVLKKYYGETITLANALFTRKGFVQTGWTLSDGGAKVYDLDGIYADNATITLYPFFEPAAVLITDVGEQGATIETNADTVATLVFVGYDVSGRLLGVDVQGNTEIHNGTHTYSMGSALSELEAYTVKLMILDNLQSLCPLCDAKANR